MLKYLLVMAVVGGLLWLMLGRGRQRGGSGKSAKSAKPAQPQAMLRCARCGLHLPAADALLDGSRVYCCEAHRSQGPTPAERP